MLIKSYEEYTEADTIAANFPALQYAFLPQDVTTGDTEWVDRINSLAVAPSVGSFTKDGNGAVTQSAPVLSHSGAIVKPGVRNVVLISIGFFDAAKPFQLGDAAQVIGVIVKTGNNFYVSDDGDYATITPASSGANVGSTGTPGAFGVQCDPSTNLGEMKGFDCTNAGVFTLNAAGAITTVNDGDLGDGVSAYAVEEMTLPGSSSAEMYGHYVFFFETLPEDIRAAVTWMQANPLKGVYPGWIGRV